MNPQRAPPPRQRLSVVTAGTALGRELCAALVAAKGKARGRAGDGQPPPPPPSPVGVAEVWGEGERARDVGGEVCGKRY
ncbi:hypothetical protein MMC34_006152 [Xylographa carneopallida]|nr:hypothetical protein [Xylographa carneopallida]